MSGPKSLFKNLAWEDELPQPNGSLQRSGTGGVINVTPFKVLKRVERGFEWLSPILVSSDENLTHLTPRTQILTYSVIFPECPEPSTATKVRDGGLFDEIPSYQFSQPNILLNCGWLLKPSIQANPESPAAAESSVSTWWALPSGPLLPRPTEFWCRGPRSEVWSCNSNSSPHPSWKCVRHY